MRLANKVGIVTAAASGMGRAGALRFAKEGAAVGVVDLDEAGANAVAKQITEGGGKAIALAGDLRQDAFARDIVRRTANAFGGRRRVYEAANVLRIGAVLLGERVNMLVGAELRRLRRPRLKRL